MTRISLAEGDHGFSQENLFSHPDFVGISLRSSSSTTITFDGQNGLFARIRGNFSANDTSRWTVTSLEIGRNDQVLVSATEMSLNFDRWTAANSESALIRLALSGNDTITSNNDGFKTWDAGSGNDLFDLGSGTDLVFGGLGQDTLNVSGDFFDAVASGGGFYTEVASGDGEDWLNGVEFIRFDNATAALQGGTSGSDRLDRVRNAGTDNDLIAAGSGNDTVTSRGGSDLLFGERGDDVLNGGRGDDRILGGADDDLIFGGSENDTLLGESGDDRLRGGTGADQLFGGADNDDLNGKAGADLLHGGSGHDKLFGANGHDTLLGGGGRDRLSGGNGNDVLSGGKGNDSINGGDGNDRLSGGRDNDTLVAGEGRDRLTGDEGADIFVFRENDDRNVVTDFQSGVDTIRIDGSAEDLSDLTFTQVQNHVRVEFEGTTIIVQNTSMYELQDVDNFLFV